MEVVYCDNCGLKISADELYLGTSAKNEDGRIYCAKCAPLFKFTTTALQKVLPPTTTGNEVTGEFSAVNEPSPAASTTKFYFCEKCGKRITDKQILEGLGRDKKLKGVYCKDCAVGVMTMEFDAVSEVDLQKAVRKPGGNSTQLEKDSVDSKSVLNKSRGGIAPAVRSPTSSHNRTSERIQSTRNSNASLTVVAGVLGTVVVTIASVFFVQGSGSSKHDAASNALNNSAHSTNRPSVPATPQGNPPIRSATPVVPQQNVNPELSPGNALVEPAVDVQKQKPHLEEARAGDDKISVTETVKDSGPAKSPTSPAGEPGKQPAPEPPINVTVTSNLLPGILKEAADLLRRNQFNAVEKLLNDKLHDPTCAGIVDRLKKEKSDLAEMQSLRGRAMDALRARAGTVVTLKKGTMTGKVKVEVNQDSVSLALMDGELAISANQLDPEDICNLLPLDKGSKTEDLRRFGLLFMAAGDPIKAEDYFNKAREAGLSATVAQDLERIASLKSEAKETAALAAWKKAESLFANKNWKAAKQAYETFQSEYAGSAAWTSTAETYNKRLEAIDQAGVTNSDIPMDNLVLWLRADVGVTKDGNNAVIKWTDQVSKKVAFTASTKLPHWILNSINGKPAIHFDGSLASDFSIENDGKFSILIVCRGKTYHGMIHLFSQDPLLEFVYQYKDEFYQVGPGAQREGSKTGLVENEWNLGIVIRDSSKNPGLVTFRNFKKVAESNTSSFQMPKTRMLLGSYDGTTPIDVDIAELLIYKAPVGDAQRHLLESYVGSKYGIK